MMEFITWDDFPFPIEGNIKFMFQTTKQNRSFHFFTSLRVDGPTGCNGMPQSFLPPPAASETCAVPAAGHKLVQ